MKSSVAKQPDCAAISRYPAKRVPPLAWTLEETATRLGLSVRTFHDLREKHPFYAPDGSRNIADDPKKRMPLWSDELVRLIAFARTFSAQGVRQFTDDEGLEIRKAMGDSRRREYLALLDE